MSITIRYQTYERSLIQVSNEKDIPNDATIIWYDFEDSSSEENEFLRHHFDFNYLEMDDTISGTPRVKYKAYEDY